MTEPLRAALARAASALGAGGAEFVLERPRRPEHGDLATNLPLVVARATGLSPARAAEGLLAVLDLPGELRPDARFEAPGFLGLRLSDAQLVAVERRIVAAGPGAVRPPERAGERFATLRELRRRWVADVVTAMGGDASRPVGGVRVAGGARPSVQRLRAELGDDALRWALLRPRRASEAVVDPAQLGRATPENPLFRVQMAHARLSGIFRAAGADPAEAAESGSAPSAADRALLRELVVQPELVERAGRDGEPSRLAIHLETLAAAVDAWYHATRAPGPAAGRPAVRLPLAAAARIAMADALTLLGLSAPERI